MRSLLLLLLWCGLAASQLRVPAGRGKRPPSLFLPATEPPQVRPPPPPSPPPVVEDPEAEADAELEADAVPEAAPRRPNAPLPPPPPPPPEEEPRRPAFRPPPPPLPAQDPLRPAFRPSAAPAFRRPQPPPPPPPQDDFPQPARGAFRQPTPEPQQRGAPAGRQVALPPPVQARPQQRNKKPVAQVIRRYREDNPDGSITWGFENDDGTFKEETIGVDCVVKGKYGYIDPDGVRREYTYNSGIPCDKNRQSENSGEGFIDYQTNKYVLPNGDSVDLDAVSKNKARKPIPPTFRN